MAPIIPRPKLNLITKLGLSPFRLGSIVLLGVIVWYASRQNLWLVGVMAVVAFELLSGRTTSSRLIERTPVLVMGIGTVLTIALLPKALSQIAVAVLYIAWRTWLERGGEQATHSLVNLILIQAVAFEGLFLAAALWNWPSTVMIVLVWIAAYLPARVMLGQRGERGAGVLAAAWALVAAELTWVFMTWLVSYIVQLNYLIVPQPTLILTVLAYCFGSIYQAQRQGKLNRGRLTEYLLIGVLLLAIVIAGTPWRGSI